MRSKLFLSFLFGMIFLMALISAAQVTQVNLGEEGYDIAYPQYEFVEQDVGFRIHIQLSNKSDGMNIANASCYLELYNRTGQEQCHSNMTYLTNDLEYELEIADGNFSDLGSHAFFIRCTKELSGWASGTFKVTPNGEEPTEAKAIFYIGLLFILVVFLLIGIYGFVVAEEIWTKTAALGINYLLLMAISFIAWNMSNDFLTSSPFLIAFLRIIFWFFILAFFPFLILLFVYGFWMGIQIDEIKKLQDQGFDPEEAADIVKKRKRWNK